MVKLHIPSPAPHAMHPAAQTFIERMGLYFEEEGLPRTAGRILGLLMLRKEPASLEQIADDLQVSKASSSTNCRLLERSGMADRVSIPGDRKDYYQVGPDMTEQSISAARTRMGRVVEVMSAAMEELPGHMTTALERIEEMHDFHSFLHDELETLHHRWRARKERGPNGGVTRSEAPDDQGPDPSKRTGERR